MRVAIFGDTKAYNPKHVTNKLDHLFSRRAPSAVVTMGRVGPEAAAERWAVEHKLPVEVERPDWETPDGRLDKAASFKKVAALLKDGGLEGVVLFYSLGAKLPDWVLDIYRVAKTRRLPVKMIPVPAPCPMPQPKPAPTPDPLVQALVDASLGIQAKDPTDDGRELAADGI